MENICGIYRITSPSGRVYIGQAEEIPARWATYKQLNVGVKRQTKLWRSFKKYGVNSHIFEVLEGCSIEDLNCRERYWQDFYDVLNGGLNCILQECGEKRRVFSEETLRKKSEALKGENNPMYGLKGELNPNFGKDLSGELNPFFGKTHSKETRKLQSEAKKGKPSPRKGAKLEAITIERMIAHKKKIVIQYDLEKNLIKEWDSLSNAARETGATNIGRACKNGSTSGGFYWEYK